MYAVSAPRRVVGELKFTMPFAERARTVCCPTADRPRTVQDKKETALSLLLSHLGIPESANPRMFPLRTWITPLMPQRPLPRLHFPSSPHPRRRPRRRCRCRLTACDQSDTQLVQFKSRFYYPSRILSNRIATHARRQ